MIHTAAGSERPAGMSSSTTLARPSGALGGLETSPPVVVASARRSSLWVRGPAWDSAWILSALWLAPVVLWLASGSKDPQKGPLDSFFFVLTALLWIGHRFGSTWLAYFTTAYRPLVRAEPVRFVVVPIAVAAFYFVALLLPDRALPWTRAQRVLWLVIVDYLLVTYHFAAQHFGVLCLYRVRAGRAASHGVRRLDRAVALVVGGALVVAAEVVAGTVYRIDVWIDPWLAPARVDAVAAAVRTTGTALAAAGALAVLVVELRSTRFSFPRVAYAGGLAAMVAAAFHARTPFVFVVIWSAQHWLVATGLSTLVARAEPPPPSTSRLRSALHAVNRRPWALLLVLAAVSVLLLPILEVEGVEDDGELYASRIFGGFATALRHSTWVPALLAFGLTTAFLHYWLDRSVYRFSSPETREAAKGLLAPADARSVGRSGSERRQH